jgi:hypothetical protein
LDKPSLAPSTLALLSSEDLNTEVSLTPTQRCLLLKHQ